MRKLLFVLINLSMAHAYSQGVNIDELAHQLTNAKTGKEKFTITRKMFDYYEDKRHGDSMRILSTQLLNIAQKEKNDSLLIRAYGKLSSLFWLSSDYSNSIEYNFKAINLAEKIGENIIAAGIYSNTAWGFIALKNYSQAVIYCKKAIEIASTSPGDRQKVLMYSYNNLALAYIGLQNTDSALFYTQLAYSINIKEQDLYEQAQIFFQFGRVYQLLNENDLAETYYQKAIDLSLSKNYSEATSMTAVQYSKLLLSENKIAQAKYYNLIGLQAALIGGYNHYAIDNAEGLQNIHEKLNDTDSAYHYLKMVNRLNDSTFNAQRNLHLQNVIFTQKLHEKDVLQQKESDNLERKHNLQYAAIGIGLVTFIILFLLFSYSIIANQKLIRFLGVVALLLVFEFINLYLHPHIGNLTHHSPLLMLAIMVCIAALLVPLHHKMEHWITHKMVEKNNKIRLAAAKKTIANLEPNTIAEQ